MTDLEIHLNVMQCVGLCVFSKCVEDGSSVVLVGDSLGPQERSEESHGGVWDLSGLSIKSNIIVISYRIAFLKKLGEIS